ncbi:MAG: ATP-binding protein, partial [Candidatus Nanohaloarchaea archaeon]
VQLSFSALNMEKNELIDLVPDSLTNSQMGVLYNALKRLREKDEDYSLTDVMDAVSNEDSTAKWNLLNSLEQLERSGLFTEDPVDLEDLVSEGEATVINLKAVEPEAAEMTMYMLASRLFELRKKNEVPPFLMVIEEAHNFVPERNFGKAVCSDILRTVASEGRKFGLGLGVVSQRPARVDKNILSQCNTQMIMRVTNPNDLNAISRSFEGVTSEVKDFITSLPPGVGLLLGKEYPVMTDIRTRKSRHGGETKELSRGNDGEEQVETSPQGEVGESPENPEPGTGGEPGRNSREKTVERFKPSLDFREVENKAGEATVAYYPVYLVETKSKMVAVDAVEGGLKGVEHVEGLKSDVLEILKRGERSRGDLLETLDSSLGRLGSELRELENQGAVEEEGNVYTYTGFPGFQRETETVELDRFETLIDAELGEEEAARVAAEETGEEPGSVEKVYYPYYKAGDQVFDAVRSEEI